jgi:hypothetical protein
MKNNILVLNDITTIENNYCKRIYFNTQMLASYYNVKSPVFELFAIAQDRGSDALEFIEGLYSDDLLNISEHDYKKLQFACKYLNKSNRHHILYNDLIVQICWDAYRLDMAAVNNTVKINKMCTGYARNICRENSRG